MGWSCAHNAGIALDKMMAACVKSTGMSNCWKDKGYTFYFEASRKEHMDGSVTGTVSRFCNTEMTRSIQVGYFKIDPSGKMVRGPKFLKDVVNKG